MQDPGIGGFDDPARSSTDQALAVLTAEDIVARLAAVEERQREQGRWYEDQVARLAENVDDAAIVALMGEWRALRDLVECQHREDYERLEQMISDLLGVWENATDAIAQVASFFRGRLREPTTRR